MNPENEKLARAFYDSLSPGHRERLFGLLAAHVVYEVPEGMPTGGGRFEGIADVRDRFLPNFYAALDVHLLPEEFISEGEHVVVIGRLEGKTRETAFPVDVPFVHVWTVRDDRLERLRLFTDTATLVRALGRERA
jgi:ketosteroid isomerase-like protein